MSVARALHYVFKIGDRRKSYEFFIGTLGMKVLRHEEFSEGCEAECNGPYNGKWSKTMVGYGSEDGHFVIELTYNYEIGGYKLGNDYRAIHVEGDEVLQHALEKGSKNIDGSINISDPDAHLFIIRKRDVKPAVTKISLNVKDLKRSIEYWSKHLGMQVESQSDTIAILSYGPDQCTLELHETGTDVDRGSAYGRIAFSYSGDKLKELEERTRSAGLTVLKPFVNLKTPGKADVQVVILADPDDHEICFVGVEGFTELSKVDPSADSLLQKAMKEDWSNEWFKDGKKTA